VYELIYLKKDAAMWIQIQILCVGVSLTESTDSLVSTLTKSSSFSVKSMYLALKMSQVKWPHRKLWFIRAPLKVKKCICLTAHNSILTKDNLIHRGGKGKETKSCFCEGDETVDHLFFSCALAKLCWGVFRIAFGLLSTPVKLAEVGPWG
jgi:hypothetical protein